MKKVIFSDFYVVLECVGLSNQTCLHPWSKYWNAITSDRDTNR